MAETSPKAAGRVPVGVDPTRASIARVYDAMLNGKDNYEIDREVKRALLATAPELETIARDNRQWLIRVTRFLAGTIELGQIIDCGAGLPGAENTHEAASRVSSDVHVYYVDNDPLVAVHGRALLEGSDRTYFLEADLTKPDEVFAAAAEAGFDRGEPAGLMQVSTLHHVHDDLGPVEIMQRYIDQLPSGSYVALTHFFDPEDGGPLSALAGRLQEIMVSGPMGSGCFRTRSEIAAMFDGLEFVQPGLTVLPDWWPDAPGAGELLDVQRLLIGGLGRKP
ncbi:SAM-dependent methyltransferase [Amycolatopsis magusensis]|uniref:SAM-dependent methyltransferase n=1 Tax=Amycolatopsis magusensis TaxID=882444 RepID=UPI0024A97424|nr:SAM-dependent methyltransferase [Amycolatopsis magusensis]MDI5977822.1 SAM-dependent methyltransferase [Amycolatopsis magusensis]